MFSKKKAVLLLFFLTSLSLFLTVNTNASDWGTFIIYLFNSDGFNVPQGTAYDDGLWFETWLKQIATGDTSRHEGPGSPGFDYTYMDYGGGVFYGWIPISLGNYKKWNGSVWEPIDYAFGDTIFFRVRDAEDPFLDEGWGVSTCSCPEGVRKFVFDETFTEGTLLLDTLCPIMVGVDKEIDTKLPGNYFLNQNHPNPFNAITTIQYGLPEAAEVGITIYNILGERVKMLVNGYQEAGYRRVMWDGTDENHRRLESGVYFYTIRTSNFEDTKKMILLE